MVISMNRRQLIVGSLSALVAARAGAVSLGKKFPAAGVTIEYDIVWHKKPIGKSIINVTTDGSYVHISHYSEMHISILFISALSLEHKSKEVWEDGRLLSVISDTVKNKSKFSLTGKLEGDKFVLEQTEGKKIISPDIATTDSFWLMSSVKHEKLLDSRSGEIFQIKKDRLGTKKLTIHDNDYDVDGYRISTEKLSADLWYHGDFLLTSDVTEDGQTAHLTSKAPL